MSGPDVSTLRAAASAAMNGGRLTDAAAMLQRLLTLQPNDSAALAMLGVVQVQLGGGAEAETTLERAAAANPADVAIRFNLGLLRRLYGKVPEAVADFEAVVSHTPGHLGAWMNLGDLFLETDQAAAAKIAYGRAAELAPQIPEPRLGIARAANTLQAFEEAEAACSAALAAAQGFAEAWFEMGRACLGLGRLHDAEIALGNTLRLATGNAALEAAARDLLASIVPRGAAG